MNANRLFNGRLRFGAFDHRKYGRLFRAEDTVKNREKLQVKSACRVNHEEIYSRNIRNIKNVAEYTAEFA